MSGNDVTTKLKVDNRDVQRELNGAERSFKKFGSSVKRVGAAIGAAFAARKIFQWGSAMFELYTAQEEAELRLAKVIENTGGKIGHTADELKLFASELQQLTTTGDEATLSLMALIATFDNISGENFKEITKLSLDLAASFKNLDPESAARMLSMALAEPEEGLRRLRRVGVTFTQGQEELVEALVNTGHVAEAQALILDKVGEKVGGMAETMGATPAGKLKQFANRMGDIGEKIGASLVPALETLMPIIERAGRGFEIMAGLLDDLIKWYGQTAVSIYETLAPAFEWLQEVAITAFATIATAVVKWQDVMTVAFNEVALVSVQVWESMSHYLTSVLPEYLDWFSRNWTNVFTDIYNVTTTIFSNMWKNVEDFFTNTWKWLKGESTDWQWTGLTEGFESTLEELPKIAARQETQLERNLQKSLGGAYRRLGREFQNNMDVGRAAMGAFWNNFTPATAAADGPKLGPDGKPMYGMDKPGVKRKKDEEAADGSYKASIEDLVAMNRRITQAAAGGGAEALDKKLLAEQKKAREAAEKLAAQQDIANRHLAMVATNTQTLIDEMPGVGALR